VAIAPLYDCNVQITGTGYIRDFFGMQQDFVNYCIKTRNIRVNGVYVIGEPEVKPDGR
jgi:hypothetical protein